MKFGAVYCIYDDHEYLEISLNSIKSQLDKILLLISDIPWNGKIVNNSKTIEFVKDLCSKNKNFQLIQGHWSNEIDQRNFGLTQFFAQGIDYYFIIDSDEIYHSFHFKNIIEFIRQNPSISAFHIEWNTYWTKQYYVISPREYYKPIIAVKVAKFLFTKIRHGSTCVTRTKDTVFIDKKSQEYNYALIPPQVAICFHLSYARTDEYMLRKLESNSHAPEFINNWYEKVWKTWTPEKQNLHPVTPNQYNIAKKEDFSIFPNELKTFIKKERNNFCSIIILNWNSFDYLIKCIKLINKNTKRRYEIIVVDNGSKNLPEAFPYILKSHYIYKIILNKENLGFAPAVNQAIQIADKNSDICLINVDAEPQENWLDELYKTMEYNPSCGIAGPLGNKIENGYQREGFTNKDIKVFNVHFYCTLISRYVIDKIGLLDEQFKIGGYEDNDFCIRSNLAGFECWISAKSLVKHEAHQIYKLNGLDHTSIDEKNKQLLQEKLISAFYKYAQVINYYDVEQIAKETNLIIRK
jgi:hypothetical protein